MTARMTPALNSAVTPDQHRASDPAASVWVGASAGTGKTKVLTDRVLRLLLGGTAPERILCLTFTRAAAAEMALRITRALARWTVAEDEALAASLAVLTGAAPGQATLDRARRLFATVLDVPDGLKIQTIHAFCQSLLRRFPLEAGVAPNFEIADERMSWALLGAARARLLGAARPGADAALAAALAGMTAVVGEETFSAVLADVSRERDRFSALIGVPGGTAGAVSALRARLGVPEGATAASLLAAACADDAFDGESLVHAARVLAGGKATDQKRAQTIANWLDADPATRVAGFAAYRRAFFSQGGEPLQRLITKAPGDAHPEAVAALGAEQARIAAFTERWNAARVAESSAALIAVAARHLALYDGEKARHAVLDYGDQIAISRSLLGRAGIAPWVLFKLDGGLDHLLIDEAQDTSPAQWSVIAALADEFFAGEGARAAPRTLFAVGDEKQSIFSFQGADARALAAAHRSFRSRAEAAGRPWQSLPLAQSFRSTAAVLAVVDAVFARPAAHAGVTAEAAPIRHRVHRSGAGGRVELWPPVAPEGKERVEPWAPPVVRETADDPAARLAALIAGGVAGWIRGAGGARQRCLAGGPRPPHPARRRAGAGAPARALRRSPAAGLQGARCAGGGDRPHGADRTARGHGPDRARQCLPAAGRRPDARHGAQEPVDRARRGRSVRPRARARRRKPVGDARPPARRERGVRGRLPGAYRLPQRGGCDGALRVLQRGARRARRAGGAARPPRP